MPVCELGHRRDNVASMTRDATLYRLIERAIHDPRDRLSITRAVAAICFQDVVMTKMMNARRPPRI